MSTIDSSTLDSLVDRIREVAARRGSDSTDEVVEREIARQSEVSLVGEHSDEVEVCIQSSRFFAENTNIFGD
jgi:hypothetical protein